MFPYRRVSQRVSISAARAACEHSRKGESKEYKTSFLFHADSHANANYKRMYIRRYVRFTSGISTLQQQDAERAPVKSPSRDCDLNGLLAFKSPSEALLREREICANECDDANVSGWACVGVRKRCIALFLYFASSSPSGKTRHPYFLHDGDVTPIFAIFRLTDRIETIPSPRRKVSNVSSASKRDIALAISMVHF